MDRRVLIKSALASPLLLGARGAVATDTVSTLGRGIHVPAGQDRFKEPLKLGRDRLDVNVSTKDTNGGLYIFEGTSIVKGGPPRHVHLEQDEWFYVIKGEFRFEVGDEKFTVGPGGSVFGPRKVPHVWASVSDTSTMLMAVQPAGTLEAFFQELAKLPPHSPKEEIDKLFEAHGMKMVGEPLKVE
jgi:mannose-6-phosphate isomerase-like protein (cupin superfamily)